MKIAVLLRLVHAMQRSDTLDPFPVGPLAQTRDHAPSSAWVGNRFRLCICVRLTEAYVNENEQTVDIHVDVRHTAARRIGQKMTLNAKVLEISGNKKCYAVTAINDAGVKIGEGTHRRATINTKKFASDYTNAS